MFGYLTLKIAGLFWLWLAIHDANLKGPDGELFTQELEPEDEKSSLVNGDTVNPPASKNLPSNFTTSGAIHRERSYKKVERVEYITL